jgi:hypothetical protein
VPITRPGNDEGDQLKQAITWQDIEASLAAPDEQAAMTCTPILTQ